MITAGYLVNVLQRGRDPKTAETAAETNQLSTAATASTGPRSEDRGDPSETEGTR